MNIEIFYTRYQANKHAKTMVGWKTKIIAITGGFIIECNGTKYLRTDGFVN